MTLTQLIKNLHEKGELESFAERCETTVGQLKQVAGSHRRAGESLAINIERESDRQVLADDLRPDVDWNFIRSTDPTLAV